VIEHSASPAPASDPGGAPTPDERGRRRAASIYGTVVTAAVIAAAGDGLGALGLAVTIVVTLMVYWLAEQYSELLGEHASDGQLPSLGRVRASLASAWPMVTASYLPVASLVVASAAGASTLYAADLALGVAIALLILHAYRAGTAAGLRGFRLVAATSTAGALGLAMVVLKALLQHGHY